MLSPEVLQQLYQKWQELLNKNEWETLRKLICVDGKTMRSNRRKDGKPNHIIEGDSCICRVALGLWLDAEFYLC